MSKKIRVGILFGGQSCEHEVSLQSAKNIIQAIDKNKYEIVLIGIDKKGRWYLQQSAKFLLNADSPKSIKLNKASLKLAVNPAGEKQQLVSMPGQKRLKKIDVVFPVLHGPFGEDGTIQGLLKLMGLPFVGASVLGSAVGMDKDVMKRLVRDAKIPIANFVTIQRNQFAQNKIRFSQIKKKLGLPVFVKPANLGSSVGINKAKDKKDFEMALKYAFEYDNKVIIEEYIKGREIECSVLGNQNPIASLPGEVVPQDEFYSYQAKYIDENGALLKIPAKLSKTIIKQIQNMAVQVFKVLNCEGMARIDFFLTPKNKIIFNEINTIPGFTEISMYPKLWQASGIPYSKLIDHLISLAMDRFEQESRLKTSYT